MDKIEFVNGWYILIIVSDLLTTIGSILKIEIVAKVIGAYCYKLNHAQCNVVLFP